MHISGTSPGDALAWAAHVLLPANSLAAVQTFHSHDHASQIGCLFLGLYSCRNMAASLSLLREKFVLIEASTLLELQICV